MKEKTWQKCHGNYESGSGNVMGYIEPSCNITLSMMDTKINLRFESSVLYIDFIYIVKVYFESTKFENVCRD